MRRLALIAAAAFILAGAVVAIVLLLTAPSKVPCADPFGPDGKVTHLYCEGTAGVTPYQSY